MFLEWHLTHVHKLSDIYRQHCVQRKAPVFKTKLLRGRFWGFAPRRGNTLNRCGWNEIWHGLRAKFHLHRCNDKRIRPQNWNFYWYFTKLRNISPRRDIFLAQLSWNLQSLYLVSGALTLKISMDLLKGYGVMGILSWGGRVSTKFSAPPSGETMRQTPKVFEGQERARGPLSPCQVWWGSDFTRRGGQKSCCFCLSVCSSRFWTSEIVRPISPQRRWSTETILIPLDRGRFVVVHPCSTFADCCQLATPLDAEVQKMAKMGLQQNKPIETKFGK